MKEDTDYCKVTAIIRCGMLEKVEQRLKEIGVPGVSVTQVKGYGEYTNFYTRDWMSTHARVEIFTYARLAENIAHAVMEAAHTGVEGDGIVAVLPVHQVFRIRTRELLRPDAAPR